MTTRMIGWMALGMVVLLSISVTRASQDQAPKPTGKAQALKDDREKRSYAIGMNLGTAIRRQAGDQSADLDVNVIVQGFTAAFGGDKTLLTEAEMRVVLNAMQADLKSKQALRRSEQSAEAKFAGDAFLAENKTKEGVVTLPSGLQYKVLEAGDGNMPTVNDTVICHYRGTLIDGTEFDNSHRTGNPATVAVAKVIKGWTEALQLMPVGSKWQLFIPPHLAYGERGAGSRIGPNETLLFEIELLSIQSSEGSTTDSGTAAAASASDRHAIEGKGGIKVSFKLDPRITKALYVGDRWVSAPFSQRGDEKQVTLEARAEAVDAEGKQLNTSVQWVPGDSTLLTVASGKGNQVAITVSRGGQTSLRLIAGAFSTELTLKAEHSKGALEVTLSEKK